MLKIKVFDESHEKDLENGLNHFSEDLEQKNQEIIDIKFSTSHMFDDEQNQIYCFSALVMYDDKISKEYKPKKYEIIEKVSD